MVADIESCVCNDDRIKMIQSYATKYPQFNLFLGYAFFNPTKSSFGSIPSYKSNLVDITFSYIKMEKGLLQLKYFFEGKDFIVNTKKRTDKLLAILEEMSWEETPIYEKLVLNKYKNDIITKDLILTALPAFARGAK